MAGDAMSLVLGLGLRATASLAAFAELAARLGAPPDCPVALPAFRADLPLVAGLRRAGRQIRLIPAQDLCGMATPSQSPRSLAQYGTGSVAEACALLACGPAGEILARSLTSIDRSLTAALAQSAATASFLPSERPLP